MRADFIIHNVNVASMHNEQNGYGIIEKAEVAVKDAKIIDVAVRGKSNIQTSQQYDGQGKWLLPGFIDCHTHLVYGGNRSAEFEQRLQGHSYTEIAQAGGGIQSTVASTRAESHQSLLQSAIKRARRLAEEGVTCIEIKSGYGLDLDTEIKMLEVIKRLPEHVPINTVATYLGAHTVPNEFKGKPDQYIDYICSEVIPYVADRRLAQAVDVFCETIGFSNAQCRKVFVTAQQAGLDIKAHVEQLSNLQGAVLAAAHGALSVDHIEYLADQDIAELKKANCVAVLLPGAFYYLHEKQKPPVQGLREQGVPMAVATDLNPGSSPVASLLTAANMAAVLFGLTPLECLLGITAHAAQALGLESKGRIAEGYDADLCLWDVTHPAELIYGINTHRPTDIWLGGKHVKSGY